MIKIIAMEGMMYLIYDSLGLEIPITIDIKIHGSHVINQGNRILFCAKRKTYQLMKRHE